MKCIDRNGSTVAILERASLSDDALQRVRDLLIVKLRKGGLTFRAIGRIFGLTDEGARLAFHGVPGHIRSYYERCDFGEEDLVGLGRARMATKPRRPPLPGAGTQHGVGMPAQAGH
jgi:hypothetical protein